MRVTATVTVMVAVTVKVTAMVWVTAVLLVTCGGSSGVAIDVCGCGRGGENVVGGGDGLGLCVRRGMTVIDKGFVGAVVIVCSCLVVIVCGDLFRLCGYFFALPLYLMWCFLAMTGCYGVGDPSWH